MLSYPEVPGVLRVQEITNFLVVDLPRPLISGSLSREVKTNLNVRYFDGDLEVGVLCLLLGYSIEEL
jgi:hypothetical protein